ncbi:unnamed protein product [Porites lobata]|uniref:receptor protein-tyrosine kinase n=1 Tax=Porites lobata TaxID=104759 RepID=A0ABN8NET7_9CNID|nr:unnamed protein product [Porites lobata]
MCGFCLLTVWVTTVPPFYRDRTLSVLNTTHNVYGCLSEELCALDTTSCLSVSAWEVAPKQVELQHTLGSGSFGEVWKAVVSGLKGSSGETTVAVKKLKVNCSDLEKESLAQEIELGKTLDGDRHPNIVNFLGCVSTSAHMMLILEYVPYGDLLGYLRKSRGMEDKYYNCPESWQEEVTSYDLLSFAQQIASGMSFLASKKIIHRDLAARNVLVGVGRICKITDFGLALIRDKYQYLYCTAIRKGRLPIKWTAPEHLFNDAQDKDVRVSEKSDVWSYGVVLYEIFTLGGTPYPDWNEWKVVYEIKVNKHRMSQPEHISDELYQIMLECWDEDPNNRPTFKRLHETITEFLQVEHYLDLEKYEPSLYKNVEEIASLMNRPAPEGDEVNWTRVIIKTKKRTYDVGDTLDLDCKVKETSKPIFAQWIKHAGDIVLENKTIPPATDDFKPQEYHRLRHKINKVSLDQTGTYICQAKISTNSSQPPPKTQSVTSSDSNSTALVASVSVLSALLFLMTGICLVYQRRRFVGNCSDVEKKSLAQEIELGKSLDGNKHPNIVNFLGCVSTSAPMMLILEYVPYGDLLGYLRKSRGMEDKYYTCPESCQQEVTSYDLLSFAQQIASGMSFLASKKILHRDLAARNVLVGVGRICKITDFGLALIRDKYQYLYCTAIRKGRLPIKWTAPEHLFNDAQDKDVRVSEKSDVWSYGVVLYEIFTLGGTPYPDWNEWKVVYEIKVNKHRMSQPEHISDELYQIMLECWDEDPNNRPTFERLHETITGFLKEEHYVDLDKYEPSLYTNVQEMPSITTQPARQEDAENVLEKIDKDSRVSANKEFKL